MSPSAPLRPDRLLFFTTATLWSAVDGSLKFKA